ncbi:MAG: hypothetical protein ABIJ97_18140, partial [Bacteroidota bacterium]
EIALNELEKKKAMAKTAAEEEEKRKLAQQMEIEERRKKALAQYQIDARSAEEFEKNIKKEQISDQFKEVLKVTVTEGPKITIYRMVRHNWGGIYYFRDNLNISPVVFDTETN